MAVACLQRGCCEVAMNVGRLRSRWFLYSSIAYLLIVLAWVLFFVYGETLVTHLYEGRLGLLSDLLIHKDAPSGSVFPLHYYTVRFAGYFNAGLILSSLVYLLTLGLLAKAKWCRVLCANTFVFLVILMLIEGGTRLLGWDSPRISRAGVTDRGVWSYDQTKGWFHLPDADGRSNLGGPDKGIIHINSKGLRGKDFDIEKAGDTTRILVIGDSFVFGVGVDEDHLMTTHLQRMLNESSHGRYEVINMGVSGYSTDQEYILFEELGKKLSPDVIVFFFCSNDFAGNLWDFAYDRYYKPYYVLNAQGELSKENAIVPVLTPAQQVKLWLAEETNIWNFFRTKQSNIGVVRQFLSFFDIDTTRVPTDGEIELAAAIIRRFAVEAAEIHSSFIVTNTAHRGDAGGGRKSVQALAVELEKAQITYFDLWPVLDGARRQSPEKLWDFPGNGHWNIDAHRLVAEAIYDFLTQAQL